MEKPAFKDLYKSSFNKKSTAEDVTKGLDLTGKNILVTGVNSGFGLETARVLVMRGAHVLGTARTMEKAKTALDALGGKTTPLACELSDPQSVIDCANAVNAMDIQLDVLMCNAGVMMIPKLEQVLGIEKQMFVNTFGHYLLINRLLESLKKADEPRVVITSSQGEGAVKPLDLDDLGANKKYDSHRNYNISKLTNNLLMVELSKRYESLGITVNCVEPGAAMTGLERHMSGFRDKVLLFIGKFFMSTVPECTATQVLLATDKNYKGTTGHFFGQCQPRKASKQGRDEVLAGKFVAKCDDVLKDFLLPL